MLEVGAALSHEQRLVIFAAHPPETSDLAPIMCWIGRGTRVSSMVDEVYLDHPRGLVAFPEPRRTPLRRGSPLFGERKVAGNRNPKPKSSRARQAWSRPPDSPSKSTIEHGFAPDCIPNFRGCLSQTTSRPPGPPHLSEDARTCWTLRGDHPQPHGTIIIPSACRRSGRHNIKTAATGMRLARHFG